MLLQISWHGNCMITCFQNDFPRLESLTNGGDLKYQVFEVIPSGNGRYQYAIGGQFNSTLIPYVELVDSQGIQFWNVYISNPLFTGVTSIKSFNKADGSSYVIAVLTSNTFNYAIFDYWSGRLKSYNFNDLGIGYYSKQSIISSQNVFYQATLYQNNIWAIYAFDLEQTNERLFFISGLNGQCLSLFLDETNNNLICAGLIEIYWQFAIMSNATGYMNLEFNQAIDKQEIGLEYELVDFAVSMYDSSYFIHSCFEATLVTPLDIQFVTLRVDYTNFTLLNQDRYILPSTFGSKCINIDPIDQETAAVFLSIQDLNGDWIFHYGIVNPINLDVTLKSIPSFKDSSLMISRGISVQFTQWSTRIGFFIGYSIGSNNNYVSMLSSISEVDFSCEMHYDVNFSLVISTINLVNIQTLALSFQSAVPPTLQSLYLGDPYGMSYTDFDVSFNCSKNLRTYDLDDYLPTQVDYYLSDIPTCYNVRWPKENTTGCEDYFYYIHIDPYMFQSFDIGKSRLYIQTNTPANINTYNMSIAFQLNNNQKISKKYTLQIHPASDSPCYYAILNQINQTGYSNAPIKYFLSDPAQVVHFVQYSSNDSNCNVRYMLYNQNLTSYDTAIFSMDYYDTYFNIQTSDSTKEGVYQMKLRAYVETGSQQIDNDVTILIGCYANNITSVSFADIQYDIGQNIQPFTQSFAGWTFTQTGSCPSLSFALLDQNNNTYDSAVFSFNQASKQLSVITTDPTKVGLYQMKI